MSWDLTNLIFNTRCKNKACNMRKESNMNSEPPLTIQNSFKMNVFVAKTFRDMNWWPSETVALCPAILPKIIWCRQTEKRKAKSDACNMTDEGSLQKYCPLLWNKRTRRIHKRKNIFCANLWRKSPARIFGSSQYLRPDHNLLLVNKLKIWES